MSILWLLCAKTLSALRILIVRVQNDVTSLNHTLSRLIRKIRILRNILHTSLITFNIYRFGCAYTPFDTYLRNNVWCVCECMCECARVFAISENLTTQTLSISFPKRPADDGPSPTIIICTHNGNRAHKICDMLCELCFFRCETP